MPKKNQVFISLNSSCVLSVESGWIHTKLQTKIFFHPQSTSSPLLFRLHLALSPARLSSLINITVITFYSFDSIEYLHLLLWPVLSFRRCVLCSSSKTTPAAASSSSEKYNNVKCSLDVLLLLLCVSFRATIASRAQMRMKMDCVRRERIWRFTKLQICAAMMKLLLLLYDFTSPLLMKYHRIVLLGLSSYS